MTTNHVLFGESLRSSAEPWLEELGKSDRDRLLALFGLATAEKTRLSDCLTKLFPGQEATRALADLTRLRKRLNDAADGDKHTKPDLGFRFHVDTKKKNPPTERWAWFTGPDAAVARVSAFSARVTRDIEGKPHVASRGIATTGRALAEGKRFVRFFVSYARANKDLADALVMELKSQFGCSGRYEVEMWMDHDVMVGDRWHERIQSAVVASDFGLFLIGPEFLNRQYIREYELPHYVGDSPSLKPVIPVGLIKVNFQAQDLLGLTDHQIFRMAGKNAETRFYEEMPGTANKREFAHQLFLEITRRLDAHFGSPSSGKVDKGILDEEPDGMRLLSSEDAVKLMRTPEETRHFQRTRGYAHHLSDRERLDDAKFRSGESRDALDELEAWACRPDASPFFALLGEVGIGKTTTLKQLTRQLLEKRRADPAKYPLPIYIDLRDYVGDQPGAVPTIEELLSSVIQRSWRLGDRSVCAADILRLVREEGALIIFDGLDEKIVHLTQSRAREFIRTLWSVLPDAMLPGSGASAPAASGKLLISCRSHYFRDVWSQNAMLTGEDRESIDRARYPAFCLLPFTEAQIRGYLTDFLDDAARADAAFALIAGIHNLRDLAERPYLLNLIGGRLAELEELQMRGETVNAARLYDLVVRSWLNRDDGKHQIDAAHKRRLMEALAAALWCSGDKQWDVDRLEDWLDDYLHQNPAIAAAYANKDRSLLKEDLRTATFVLRPDSEDKDFRFAHTSLQEYFLACHLARALKDKADSAWDMPMVSRETLDFLGQILALQTHPEVLKSLERLLGANCLPAACLAFQYWLEAISHGHPEPKPAHVNLAGANLDEQTIRGRSREQPLNLRGANLRGAQLNRSRVEFVDISEADLTGAEARQALFLNVNASGAKLVEADVAGLQWRHGRLDHSQTNGTRLESIELQRVEVTGLTLPTAPRAIQSMSRPQTYVGHRNSINACAWNPRGTAIATASEDGRLVVWDAGTGKELFALAGGDGSVWSCAWSPDGSRLLCDVEDDKLTVWDALIGKELFSLAGHADYISCCAWSSDGSRLLSGSGDNTLKLWDADTGRELLSLAGHADHVSCCAWSPGGTCLLSGSGDKTLKLWNAATGKELSSLTGHADNVNCCAWSPDGSRLLSGSSDKTLKLWEAATGKELLTLDGHTSWVSCCAWSPDGTRLLSSAADNTLKVWDAATGKELLSFTGHAGFIGCCAWSPDGTRLLSGGHDSTLKMWTAETGKELFRSGRHFAGVVRCAWSLDGLRILSGDYNTVRVWNVSTGATLLTLGSVSGFTTCAISSDGRRIITGEVDQTLKVWDAVTGNECFSLRGDSGPVNTCAWSPDGRSLLAGSGDRLKVWDASTGDERLCLTGHSRGILTCAWSPDGRWLLSGAYDNTLKVWAAETGEECLSLCGHTKGVYACGWSPDGRSLLSRSYDGKLKIWDAITGRQRLSLDWEPESDLGCAWSPDSRSLVCGTSGGVLQLWDVSSGERLAEIVAHEEAILACAWSPDGSFLISGSDDHTLKLWDAASGECLWTGHHLPEHQSATIDGKRTRILHATPEAWRWLGWEERDAKGRFIQRLPAEAFGPIPGMED